MLLVGAIAVSVPVIMSIKQRKENIEASTILSRTKSEAEASTHVEDPPFNSFGFDILRLTNTEGAVMALEKWLEGISVMVNESILVSLVCVPIGFYYFGHSLLCRVMPKTFSTHIVTSDEWLLALSVFFVLGRESSKLDMAPTMKDVQDKLKASHEILQDVLPSHVIDLLVNSSTEVQEELDNNTLGPPDHYDKTLNMRLDPVDEDGSGHGSGPGSGSGHGSARGSSINRRRSTEAPKVALGTNGSLMRSFKLAENHDCVTVFFSDIVGFSSWAHSLPASRVMETLNDLYTRLDDVLLTEMPGLYKVETIGDAYMVAGNLVTYDSKHAATVIRFAMRAQQEASKVPRPDMDDGSTLQLRIGESNVISSTCIALFDLCSVASQAFTVALQ
jgi:hypothetical protein